jgi:hypothetical protein
MIHSSSLIVRITAWYNWLLIILVLVLGAYTCKCLDYCLSAGVQNALSIRAREISHLFAVTGQMPAHPQSPRLDDRFLSLHQTGVTAPELSGKLEMPMVNSGDVRREPNSHTLPTRVVKRTVHGAGFLVATAPSTFGSKEYVVEVRTPKKPIRAVFRQTAITMLIGLVAGLGLATVGSFFLVQRALVPMQKIASAVRALPVFHPGARHKEVVVFEQIKNLCVAVDEMAAQLEDSFQIGVGLPAEALQAPDNQLGTVRGELADMFKNERQSISMAQTLLSLLKETERLSEISRNLATPFDEQIGPTRAGRLKFYLGGLALSGAEHICVLTKELGAELTFEARVPAHTGYSVRW